MAEGVSNSNVIYTAADIGGKPWEVSSGAGVNIIRGAQYGQGPNIMALDGATPNVLNACYLVVIQMPQMWVRTNQTNIVNVWRTLLEIGAKNVDGIDFGYQLEVTDTLVSHDGQNAGMPTVSRRTQINPTFTWPEYYGNLVWNATQKWIMDIQHPDTQVSNLTGEGYSEEDIPAWLYSTFSASMCVIQPDPLGIPDRIQDAYFVCNLFPTETGMGGFKRTINNAETPERSVPFRGLVQHNANTRTLGLLIAKSLNAHRINWQFATTATAPNVGSGDFVGIDKQVYEALRDFKFVSA